VNKGKVDIIKISLKTYLLMCLKHVEKNKRKKKNEEKIRRERKKNGTKHYIPQ
jgi:hypothetical protein